MPELVVYVYQNLATALNRQIPLLRDNAHDPFEVSPNDLADQAISNLVELPEAVCLERTDLPNRPHPASAVYASKDWEKLGIDNLNFLVELKTAAKSLDLQRQDDQEPQKNAVEMQDRADTEGRNRDDIADKERR